MDKKDSITAKNTSQEAQRDTERATGKQIGGNHYKTLKIQPIEYSMANKLNACQSNVIKYVTRYNLKHQDKNLQKEDIKKAIHVLEMLIEFINKEDKHGISNFLST